MSKYTLIANELVQINDAKFQLICNAFLTQEYKGDIYSPGTVEGKEKTRKGKPDTFLLQDNGKYLLAEYTTKDNTDKTAFYQKLENDLKDCLDFEKFGIQNDQVNQIILCCNSTVDIAEIEKLSKLSKAHNIPLRVVGLESLSMHFFTKGKYFAREYLGVPFDTGQMLTKSDFLKQYGKKNLSTPLDNTLKGREEDLNDLLQTLQTNHITIVKGAAGVGKSRLSIQAINEFLKDNSSYIAYYIFPKTGSIAEDLTTYLEKEKQYILFIDDANRQIDNFMSIIYRQIEMGETNIKIIATVRDYAKDDVIKRCRSLSPQIFNLEKLSDEIVIQIISGEDYGITDNNIIDRIVKISNGNPRLAIMAARVIKDKADPEVLKDVTSIYDEYFQSLIDDKEIFGDKIAQKILGLISFFHTMDMEEEFERSILETFEIPYATFFETAHRLEELEIVDVYLKYTVKISEQVLATYFFYRVFIKEDLLDFSLLLNRYFEKYAWRMKDSFDPANAAFGDNNVLNKVKASLTTYWESLQGNEDQSFSFLGVFGKYLPTLVFSFLFKHINKLPGTAFLDFDYQNSVKSKSNYDYDLIINLLEPHYSKDDAHELTTALELSIQYVSKKADLYDILLKKLKESLALCEKDLHNKFTRQNTIYDYLLLRLENGILFRHLFYYLFNHLLLNSYYSDEFYEKRFDKWQLIDSFQEVREKFWKNILDNYKSQSVIGYDLLIIYLDNIQYYNKVLLEFDIKFLSNIITSHFSKVSFGDSYFVHLYSQSIKEKGIVNRKVQLLKKKFTTEAYKVFSIMTWDRMKQRELQWLYKDYDKVEKYKEEEIRKKLAISTLTSYKIIHDSLREIIGFRYSSRYELQTGMDTLLAYTFKIKPALAFEILNFYLADGNLLGLAPVKFYKAIFAGSNQWHIQLLSLINKIEFQADKLWQERYFYFLPEEHISSNTVNELLAFYKKCDAKIEIYPGLFDKYLPFEKNIYSIILELLVSKRNADSKFTYKVGYQFFAKNQTLVDNHFQLCKEVYFHQEDIDRNYDSDCSEFFALFQKDNKFLFEYLDYLNSKYHPSFASHFKHFVKLWEHPGAEEVIYRALIKLKSIKKYDVSDHIATSFFISLGAEYHERAYNLLKRIINTFSSDAVILNMVLDIARNCLKTYHDLLIKYYLTLNSDIELFRKLRWNNNHFSSSGDAIWADFKAVELRQIYAVIKDIPEPTKYILHLDDLERKIGYEERESAYERKLQFRGLR